MPFGRNRYIAALENRVTELESYLTSKGLIDDVPSFSLYDVPDAADRTLRRPGTEQTTASAIAAPPVTSSQLSAEDNTDMAESELARSDSMVHILRDLSLESNGGYIGATSHFTIGRLVNSIVQGKHAALRGSNGCSPSSDNADDRERPDVEFEHMSAGVADKLFHGYMKHVATRYPVLQSGWIHSLHMRRNSLVVAYERSTLHLVYAIAGRFLETTGENNAEFRSESHQAQVLSYLDEMLGYHDTRSVVTLLLLAVYSLRGEGGVGAWTYAGLAMRIAIDLGLHRQTSSMSKLGFDVELRKRLFWSCYTMDRQISIPLGRPFSIADSDIDVELPFDVDECCSDIRILRNAAKLDPNTARGQSTSLTAFLHILRLRRIESSIQQTIYRVDRSVNVTTVEVEHFLSQLEAWKHTIPSDAKSRVDQESVAFDGYDYYMVFYYKCHRFLLYPLISKPQPEVEHLRACAEVCGGVAQTYKRLHQTLSVGYSLMALQTVFMAGLTLVYCAWLNPEVIFTSAVSNDVNACCIVLFVITERWPAAKKYRDAFELVKQTVIDPMFDGRTHAPQRALNNLPSMDLPLNAGRYEYDSILTRMGGSASVGGTSSFPATAIGLEEVQYQMHTKESASDSLTARQTIATADCASRAVHNYDGAPPQIFDAQGEAECEFLIGDERQGWDLNGSSGMDFSTAIEPFDLTGYSVDMGWMAESFTSTMP